MLSFLHFSCSYTLIAKQNVAWVSFLLFAAVQFFFAVIAKSEAMMTDSAGTYHRRDYLLNLL